MGKTLPEKNLKINDEKTDKTKIETLKKRRWKIIG